MVPVDSFVCQIVHRLRFFRSFDPLPFYGRLLARPRNKQTLVKQLRSYLPYIVAAVGITSRTDPPPAHSKVCDRQLLGRRPTGSAYDLAGLLLSTELNLRRHQFDCMTLDVHDRKEDRHFAPLVNHLADSGLDQLLAGLRDSRFLSVQHG
jgi:hypothetical protein